MKPDITMFFPAYNEEDNIKDIINDAKKFLKEYAKKYEIMVVLYEGSTDNTCSIVKSLIKKNKKIRLIIQPKEKKGVGYGIKMGFEKAKYPNIFYADSDNQFKIEEFKEFLPYITEYDIIAGYRINRNEPLIRTITSHTYNFIIRLVFGIKERDVDCAFRYVNKRIFNKVNLTSRLGLGTTEILVKARNYGYKIKQIGVHHFPRKAGKSTFESKMNLPKSGVVLALLKDIVRLKREIAKE